MHYSSELFVGMNEQEKQKFKAEYKAAQYLMEPLKKILQKRIDELNINNKSEYEKPSWPYLRADKDGSKRAYEEILKLLP